MNFLVKRTWWIVLPTVLAVLAFQSYWLKITWREQERVFASEAADALRRCYDQSVLEKVLGGVKTTSDTASSFRFSSIATSSIMFNGKISSGNHDNFDTVMLRSPEQKVSNPEVSPVFLSALFSASPDYRPEIARLDSNYKKLLKERGIHLPFTLRYIKKQQAKDSLAYVVNTPLSVLAPDDLLQATFSGLRRHLLVHMRWPAAISLFLLLIVAGCIWILWRIILKQKALEVMRNDFVSNMTHELNTPVAILHTINEALLTYDGITDREKTTRYLQLSKNELNKLQEHIQQILSFSGIEGGRPVQQKELVSLHDVVNVITQRFNHLPGVVMSSNVNVQHPELRTHAESLQIILNNLVDNAIKYGDKEEQRVTVSVVEDPRWYTFTVSDNGVGIEKKHLPYLFDKFYRVPHGNVHDVKGYGLGLSHVKELVASLGGSIKVTSTPGAGSSFTFQLPTS